MMHLGSELGGPLFEATCAPWISVETRIHGETRIFHPNSPLPTPCSQNHHFLTRGPHVLASELNVCQHGVAECILGVHDF